MIGTIWRHVFGILEACLFCERDRNSCLEPNDDGKHEKKYDSHHHMYYLAALEWTDIYGLIIRVDCTILGSMHHLTIFNDSSPYCSPTRFFCLNQNVTEDKELKEQGNDFIFLFKSPQDTTWKHRRYWNMCIWNRQMVKEWSTGLTKTFLWLFWPSIIWGEPLSSHVSGRCNSC